MCPQELVLGLKKPRRIKETFLSSFQCSPVPRKKCLHPFSPLPFEHFYLNPLLVAFITATPGPSRASCFPDECWRWESLKLWQHMLLQIFLLCMYGNIYVYILNSIYMITEHYVTWGLCWFCSDRGLCCHKWTHSLQCSDLMPTWELASLLPMLIIYPCSCV